MHEFSTHELRERKALTDAILANTETILSNWEKIERHDITDIAEAAELTGNYLATLEAIEKHDTLDEDDVEMAGNYFATLEAIEQHDNAFSEDDIKQASDYLATLQEIEKVK
jgi:hypothetical protein